MVLVGNAGQIILAGDPMQMAPLCFNLESNERGLAVSMIKRLYELYSNMKIDVRICFFFSLAQMNAQIFINIFLFL